MSVAKMAEEFATVTEQEGSPKLYLTLIEEEYKEWQEEVGCGCPPRELKELSDLVYVIHGYARSKDWEIMESIKVIPQSAISLCIAAKAFLSEVNTGSPKREKLLLQNFRDQVYGYARAMGYDLETAVKRVHENNLGRCVQPDGTIQRRVDGKIKKNENYERVYLEDLV